jgi:hypothetical protein
MPVVPSPCKTTVVEFRFCELQVRESCTKNYDFLVPR